MAISMVTIAVNACTTGACRSIQPITRSIHAPKSYSPRADCSHAVTTETREGLIVSAIAMADALLDYT